MSHLHPTQPKELRARLHAEYDRYLSGEVRFPKIRLIDGFKPPRKTRQIAELYMRELAKIEEDRAAFRLNLLNAADHIRNPNIDITPGANNLVITKVGRNAIAFANLVAGETKDGQREITASVGEFDRAEFVDSIEGIEIGITDGRTIRLEDGHFVGDSPDFLRVRSSNVSGIYLGGQPRPIVDTAAV